MHANWKIEWFVWSRACTGYWQKLEALLLPIPVHGTKAGLTLMLSAGIDVVNFHLRATFPRVVCWRKLQKQIPPAKIASGFRKKKKNFCRVEADGCDANVGCFVRWSFDLRNVSFTTIILVDYRAISRIPSCIQGNAAAVRYFIQTPVYWCFKSRELFG